jgi:hypothetical protein
MGGKLDPNAALSIVPEFLRTFPEHNVQVIVQQLAAFGIVQSSDPNTALAYAFNLIAGNNGDLANAQKTASQTSVMSSDAAKKQEGSNSALIKGFTTSKHAQSTAGVIGGSLLETVTFGMTDGGMGKKSDSGAMKAYKDAVAGSGQRNPVIEALLQNVKGDPDKEKVVVHTGSGLRVMSLADAIRKHPQELSSGQVQFVGGDDKDRSVGDIIGQDKINASADWTKEGQAKDDQGQSMEDWQKKNPGSSLFGNGSGTGANGKVMIDLSDSAKQLLRIASASGVAGANGEGAPPMNSYSWNANR